MFAVQRAIIKAQKRITEEEFNSDDSHFSAEDGCPVCDAWRQQQDADRRAVNKAMLKVQLGSL